MKLIKPENEILHTELEKFDFDNPPVDPTELAQEMVKLMMEKNGLGLSANQVGLPYRMFVMRGHPKMYACFNPRIVLESDNLITLEEGCLSYPGLAVKVRRPTMIKCRYADRFGEIRNDEFYGMTARVFQHELDHLDGITMLDVAHPLHRDKALKKWKKLRKKL